jgi:hypothetical protein
MPRPLYPRGKTTRQPLNTYILQLQPWLYVHRANTRILHTTMVGIQLVFPMYSGWTRIAYRTLSNLHRLYVRHLIVSRGIVFVYMYINVFYSHCIVLINGGCEVTMFVSLEDFVVDSVNMPVEKKTSWLYRQLHLLSRLVHRWGVFVSCLSCWHVLMFDVLMRNQKLTFKFL